MRDVFAVWKNTRAIVLVALTAGVYAAVLIPFKAIPIVPGVTELRPANAIPPVCSLLFGPAAAWGCALGNLIGDFFGTVGPGSIFGFVGNFLLGYLPYRLWKAIAPGWRPMGTWQQLPLFWFVTIIGSVACALVIAAGVDWLGIVPFTILFPLISLNNAVMGLTIGPVLLALMYPRAQRWGLVADDVQDEEDLRNGPLAIVGILIVTAACVAGWVLMRNPNILSAWIAEAQTSGDGPAPMTFTPLRGGAGVLTVALLLGSALLARLPALRRATEESAVSEDSEDGAAVAMVDVSFRYRAGGAQALDSLSLEIEPGTFVALMGATGAGKSTLCRATNGLVPQFYAGDFEGRVTVLGRDVSGTPVQEHAERIGLVFQDFDAQLISSDVELEVAFALENLGVPREEMQTRVREALSLVGLSGFERRDPATLSGGEKQRVAIASVLAARPKVLVLDEPTTDLDPKGKAEVFETARQLAAEGITVLMSEHEPDRAIAADRVVALAEGKLAYDGAASALLTDPDQCASLGILSPEIPACFAAIGAEPRPTTVAEGLAKGRELGLAPDREALRALGEAELSRRERYGDTIISVEDVTHEYSPGIPAVDGVSLEIREGEFVAILGQNGSGKTTLAKHLNGLLQPTSGTVTVAGGDSAAEIARTVGYVFQDPDHQIFCATVREEVAFGPAQLGLESETAAQRVDEALESVGLTELVDEDPFTLTKGERQAVAVASALACDPKVLILDEPTTGLDGPLQQTMMGLLTELNERGRTIVIITHSMWAAASYAHRAVVMAEGKILADGPTRKVFSDRDTLAQASIEPTATAQLSQSLWGVTLLSPDEFGAVVVGGGSQEPRARSQ